MPPPQHYQILTLLQLYVVENINKVHSKTLRQPSNFNEVSPDEGKTESRTTDVDAAVSQNRHPHVHTTSKQNFTFHETRPVNG